LVLFLQNNTTKEILQGTKYSFAELFGASPVAVDVVDFGTTYLTTNEIMPLTLTNPNSTTMTGTIVSDNPQFVLTPATRLNFSIPANGSQIYNISFTPSGAGTVTGNINITTNLYYYPTLSVPVTATGSYAPPVVPQNVSVHMNGNNAVLNWSPVSQNVLGQPLTPDRYLVYSNGIGNPEGTYTLIGLAMGTTYTNINAGVAFAEKYYKITALKNYTTAMPDPESLLKPGMTEAEVNTLLQSQR
jgi:hypothetical protein